MSASYYASDISYQSVSIRDDLGRAAVAPILLRGTYVISGTLAHIALVPSLPADSQVTPFSSCAHLLCDCDYSCPCHNHDP